MIPNTIQRWVLYVGVGSLCLWGSMASYQAQASSIQMACSWNSAKSIAECRGGSSCVWHFDYVDERGSKGTSWCYKSKQRAERGRKADQKLCDMVDWFFEKKRCQTRYMKVYCRVCPSPRQPRSRRRLKRAKDKLQRVTKRLRDLYKKIKQARNLLKPSGSQNPYKNVGKVVAGYFKQLIHAKKRVEQVRGNLLELVNQGQSKINRVLDGVSQELDQVTSQLTQSHPGWSNPSGSVSDPVRSLPSLHKLGASGGNTSRGDNVPRGGTSVPRGGSSSRSGSSSRGGWRSSSGRHSSSHVSGSSGSTQSYGACLCNTDSEALRHKRACAGGGSHASCYCAALAFSICMLRQPGCCKGKASCQAKLRTYIQRVKGIIQRFTKGQGCP